MLEESSVDPGASPAVVDARVGDVIAGKYRVIRALGIGASGTVLLCEHTALQKEVAVKVLHRELADDPGLVERFQREARTTARLDHPNSVRVTDFGQDENGTLYLAMEYVAGRDLADLLNSEGPLSDERIVHIMTGVLSALSAAHALGIVHRDLKPENILVSKSTDAGVTTEVVKVCDFGIAQLSQQAAPVAGRELAAANDSSPRRITGDGMIVGTCAYMSPEQARAQPLDARSDLYAAGVVLYQLLTRTLPFQDESPIAVAVMHCDTLPPPPSTHGRVNPGLEAVCLQALSKTKDARFQTAGEMLAAVQAAVRPQPTSRSFWPLARSTTASLTPVPHQSTAIVARQGSIVPTELSARKSQPAQRGRKRTVSLVIAGASLALPAFAAVPFFSSRPAEDEESTVEPLEPTAESSAPSSAGASVAPEQDYAVAVETARVTLPPPATPAAAHRDATTNARVVRERRPTIRPAKPAAAPAPAAHIPAASPPEPEADDTAAPAVAALPPASPPPAAAVEPHEASRPELVASPVQVPSVPPALPHPAPSPALMPAAEAPREPVLTSLGGPGAPVHATVVLDHMSGGVSKASVRAAINHSAIERCYRIGGTALSSTAKLEVSTNMSGRIVSAEVTDTTLPSSVRTCIEQVARSGQIRDADVGQVHATFSLTLEH